jgi:glucuronate isomerase
MAKQDKFAALRAWVAEAQTVMGLDHWEVTIVEAASDVDAWADIEAHAQQPTADLRVAFDFWKQEPEKQRLILTHELLHLVLARYARISENLEESLGKLAWAVIEPQLEDGEERTIEHLARIIAPYLSLPAFPKA